MILKEGSSEKPVKVLLLPCSMQTQTDQSSLRFELDDASPRLDAGSACHREKSVYFVEILFMLLDTCHKNSCVPG